MSYLVLARKYRPQTFEDLVGQQHVTTTLLNALQAGRLAHAYVFSGPRGCGKTTTARLLAKALNCVKGPTPTPCGQCPQCQVIASGSSPDDVLEIDGASNRGIDQIRELRDTVKYAPARSRYRIFIIDEAHQITDQGFNALLKTLEEPPAHAVFMMATTEAQKIPGTILSRCQRFQLKPIPPGQIREQLAKIAKQEKLKVDEDCLREVSRAAHGSLRDALSLLDQLIAYAPEGITSRDVSFLLGLLPRETVRGFLATLAEGSPELVLQAVQKAVEDGFDLFQLAHDLMETWHQRLLWKSGVKTTLGDADEIEKEASGDTLPQLERNLQLISRCLEQMRRSESPRVTFELFCLELAEKAVPVEDILVRLEKLELSLREGRQPLSHGSEKFSGLPTAPPESKKKLELTPPAVKLPETAAPSEKEAKPPVIAPSPREVQRPQSNNGGSLSSIEPTNIGPAWEQMIGNIGRAKPSLEPFLRSARWELKPPNVLQITCQQTFQQQQINTNLPRIKELLIESLGVPVSIQCQLVAASAVSEPAAPAETAEEAVDDVLVERETTAQTTETYVAIDDTEWESPAALPSDADPGLKKVMDKFPGRLKKMPPSSL